MSDDARPAMNDHDHDATIDPAVEGSLAWHQTNHHRGQWNACWSGKCKRFMRAHGIELAAPHIDAGIRKSDFEKLANERDALLAEVERLKANQTPDGGFWDIDYFTTTGIGFIAATDTGEATYQRRVWHGRIEPITEVSE